MKQKDPLSIMIVEDDVAIGEKITNAFEQFIDPKEIKLARTVTESFALLNTCYFKIVVLDLSLPDGNGVMVLDRIQENQLNTKVYVFSINSELKKICIRKGAAAFFDKSSDFNNLKYTVKETLYNTSLSEIN